MEHTLHKSGVLVDFDLPEKPTVCHFFLQVILALTLLFPSHEFYFMENKPVYEYDAVWVRHLQLSVHEHEAIRQAVTRLAVLSIDYWQTLGVVNVISATLLR